jgi:hypothetical protein
MVTLLDFQIEMAGISREWFTRAVIEEMEAKLQKNGRLT